MTIPTRLNALNGMFTIAIIIPTIRFYLKPKLFRLVPSGVNAVVRNFFWVPKKKIFETPKREKKNKKITR